MESPDDKTLRLSDDLTIQPFDSLVRESLSFAHDLAMIQGHTTVRSVHLAVGLIMQRSNLTVEAIESCNLNVDRFCLALLRMIRATALPDNFTGPTSLSNTSRKILERAVVLIQSQGTLCVSEKHLWRAILMETRGVVFQAMDELGVVEAIASRLDCV